MKKKPFTHRLPAARLRRHGELTRKEALSDKVLKAILHHIYFAYLEEMRDGPCRTGQGKPATLHASCR